MYISAMGKSRSATILAAYLMASRRIPPNPAIGLIERARPIVEPNPGFAKQLELYHQMGYTAIVEDHPIYQRWVYLQDVEMSNAAGRAPERVHFRDAEAEIGKITHVKEGEVLTGKVDIELRCKKCRYVYFSYLVGLTLITSYNRCTLANSASLTPHLPKPTQPPMPHGPHGPRQQCSHHFTEPLLWMKPELSKGGISGKLECPKCKSKVGTYAWQGLKCSCGDWVVPGISVARGKVDEIKVRL